VLLDTKGTIIRPQGDLVYNQRGFLKRIPSSNDHFRQGNSLRIDRGFSLRKTDLSTGEFLIRNLPVEWSLFSKESSPVDCEGIGVNWGSIGDPIRGGSQTRHPRKGGPNKNPPSLWMGSTEQLWTSRCEWSVWGYYIQVRDIGFPDCPCRNFSERIRQGEFLIRNFPVRFRLQIMVWGSCGGSLRIDRGFLKDSVGNP